MAGGLKTLMNTLIADPILAAHNVLIAFGEESMQLASDGQPYLCVVPMGGQWTSEPGYSSTLPEGTSDVWTRYELLDLQMVNNSAASNATGIDHEDSIEDLCTWTLQALKGQLSTGLYFKPLSGRWLQMQGAASRFGRTYILTCSIEITVAGVQPTNATVTSVTHTETI